MSFSTILDAATLVGHLTDPGWLVVDVRHQLADVHYGENAYRAGHIPGAVFLHCDRDLSGPITGGNGRHPLPDPAVLASKLGDLGLGKQMQVVVYDDAQGMIAGRLWWLLRWLGHAQVAVLDGGLQAWLAHGGQLSADIPHRVPVTFTPSLTKSVFTVDALQEAMRSEKICLVDARSPDRFRGENESIDPVGGHIPGAVNRFFRDNLKSDGCFKSADQLRQEWLQVVENKEMNAVVHYCGSGVSACHNLLALEISGLCGSSLYAGSWSEWCADPHRTVA